MNAPRLLLSLTALLVGVLLGEGMLRLTGRTPVQVSAACVGQTGLVIADATRGWRNAPGDHAHPFSVDVGPVHIATDGSRGPGDAAEVTLVGGSYAFGWGVPDDAAVGRQLAERLTRPVGVQAVGGYGTVQALLTVRELAARGGLTPIVIHGRVPMHDERDVATVAWRRSISRCDRQGVAVPWGRLDGEHLIVEPPLHWPRLPGDDRAALVALAAEAWAWAQHPTSASSGSAVADAALAQMDDIVRGAGGRLVVAQLWGDHDGRRAGAWRASGLEVVDCRPAVPRVVPGDGHPDATVHAGWADCLADYLER